MKADACEREEEGEEQVKCWYEEEEEEEGHHSMKAVEGGQRWEEVEEGWEW